ncbi:MAG: RNA methyltransferase [Bacteroidaceae bacterium]|nr:RNA methyltransferase [Bacteroidaceae bacterium]
MKLKEITSLEAPELEAYSTLTEAQLRNRLEPEKGLFIAESPKVINVALDAGFEPVSLLCEQKHIEGDASGIIERCPEDMPVYTGSRELLAQLTGYTLTRGVLCAMRRPKPLSPEEVCKEARRIVVLHGVCDTTNVGAIFRSAAALGIDALLMTRDSCDPLNRRAVRVSMGSVFLVPWTWLDAEDGTPAGTVHKLRDMGFTTAAMALRKDDVNIDDQQLKQTERLALIMGTEGDGLPEAIIDASDLVVKIPMHHGVDSLNVGNAAAIAFWEICSPF